MLQPTALKNSLLWALFVAILFGAWASIGLLESTLLPTPLEVISALISLSVSGALLQDLAASLGRVTIGISAALFCGILTATTFATLKRFSFGPLAVINLLRPIPPIAWIPLSIAFFGLSSAASILIIFIGAFFPIFSATYDGICRVDPDSIARAKLLGANTWRIFSNVLFPAVLAPLLTGFQIAVGFSWMCVVASEMIAARSGLGYALQLSRQLLRLDEVVAYMFVIGAVGAAMVFIAKGLSSFLMPWEQRSRHVRTSSHHHTHATFADVIESLRERLALGGAANVEVRGLTFSYNQDGNTPILNNLSFKVNHGATVSILGESGSGKSTLAALLAGLKRAQSGEVLIDGHTPEPGVGELSLVFQGAPIFPALTAQENVAFGIVSRGIEKSEAAAFARELLSSVGLGEKALAYPSELSGGERQRVALLQALAFVPRLLILDEAFSALDCSTREKLQEDLSHILALSGVTTLMITHDISEASFLSERVLAIVKGGSIREVTIIREPIPRVAQFRLNTEFQHVMRRIRIFFEPALAHTLRTQRKALPTAFSLESTL